MEAVVGFFMELHSFLAFLHWTSHSSLHRRYHKNVLPCRIFPRRRWGPFHFHSIIDDKMFTVSYIIEPVERGHAKLSRTFHRKSGNTKGNSSIGRDPGMIAVLSCPLEIVYERVFHM